MRPPNFFGGGDDWLDRCAHRRDDEAWLAGLLDAAATRLVPVWRSHNLVSADRETPAAVTLPASALAELGDPAAPPILLGLANGDAVFALDVSHLEGPDGAPPLAEHGTFADLRAIGGLVPRRDGQLLAYARAMTFWHSRHCFCAVCGAPSHQVDAGFSRRCSDVNCDARHFPRTDPAIIVLVHDRDRVVLGRQRIWPPAMHSVLAGFAEPGESLEDAVRREVREEVSIEVDEVAYHSSQPWPFPASMMIGFRARATTFDIERTDNEFESADWYTRDQLTHLPTDGSFALPRAHSIARRLLDEWLEEG